MTTVVHIELIASKIYLIRGIKVMLDRDLAELYGVETKRLKEQARRNIERFPEDFMFELTKEEIQNLRSQFATSSWGGARYLPMAFSEHGVLMLSSVLKSERAIQVNIVIMRAFVKLRQLFSTHKKLETRIKELETRISGQDERIVTIFEAIRQLMSPQRRPRRRIRKIGFKE